MPVYNTDDYGKVIERIKQKIKAKRIEPGRTLSEEEIVSFEKQCNAALPEAYRRFLKEVGDGCDMPGGFRLKKLGDIERENLSCPFMKCDAWIWEDEDISGEEIKLMAGHGNIELIDTGDCISYNLIVSGKCRGEVWNFTDVGVQPCCERQDFLGWFELWLDEGENADYFKDYIY